MTTILMLISIVYLILIGYFIYGWNRLPIFKLQYLPPQIQFSVIIPFRNEEKNINELLYSLSKLNYPNSLFEILLIDDASEDRSKDICLEFQLKNPELQIDILTNKRRSNSPKKDAILTAINLSSYDHIITTDADCEVPINWLQAFNEKLITTKASLIAGPVGFPGTIPTSIVAIFEEIDFMSLQAAGAAAFGNKKAFMCNAANLCYKKTAFIEVEGFTGNDHISSGDDVFLLQKLQERNFAVAYLRSPEAEILTNYQQNFSSLISQRIRWAAKSSAYTSNFSKLTGLIVLLMNLFLCITVVLCFLSNISYKLVIISFLMKFYIDLILLIKWNFYFGKLNILKHYLWCSLLYPFFTSYIAILSLFSGYEWKGRKFRK